MHLLVFEIPSAAFYFIYEAFNMLRMLFPVWVAALETLALASAIYAYLWKGYRSLRGMPARNEASLGFTTTWVEDSSSRAHW